jgi:trehalose 6-phosphate phosphatase
MKDVLKPVGLDVLRQFAWSNMLAAFDFDGTLAPIVAGPSRAVVRGETRRLLAEVSQLYPVVVLSGRAREDVLRRLGKTGVKEVVGNHGIEPQHASETYLAQVRRWLPVLRTQLAALQGVWVEDKTYSVAVHYRRSRHKKLALPAIVAAAEALGDVRLIGGKQVVNVVPNGAPHKGVALENARERLGCDTALYVGDDETDEDAFRALAGLAFTFRVGQAERPTFAERRLPDVAAVETLLRWIAARPGPGGAA